MSIQDPIGLPANETTSLAEKGFMTGYLDALSLGDRLHRLFLDVNRDIFDLVVVSGIKGVGGL